MTSSITATVTAHSVRSRVSCVEESILAAGTSVVCTLGSGNKFKLGGMVSFNGKSE